MDSIELSNIKLNLKILSQVRPYERLSTIDNKIEVDRPSIFQGLRRWYRGEGRSLNMEIINQLVRRAILYVESNLRPKLKKTLLDELTNAITGLKNLKITYESDSLSVARLSVLIDDINGIIEYKEETPIINGSMFQLLES